jgi:hypothetical protein
MIQIIPVTTADVAASPTAAALRPLLHAAQQPAKTTTPNTTALIRLSKRYQLTPTGFVEVPHDAKVNMPTMSIPPTIPNKSA